MISIGSSAASARATAVFPIAVGPTMTGTLDPPKPSLQLGPGKLHDGAPPMDVMGRETGFKQPEQEGSHLGLAERHPGLDRRATRKGRRESLQPIGPATEPAPCQICDQLAKTGDRLE